MIVIEKLKADLLKRQQLLRVDRHIHTAFLKEIDADDLISIAYPYILRGLERKAAMVEIIVPIGNAIRLRQSLKTDTVSDAQVGWFIAVSFIECKILGYRLKHLYRNGKKNKHQSYFFTLKDWKAIKELWNQISIEKTNLFPTRTVPSDWEDPIHKTGIPIIKKGHPQALAKLQKHTNPINYDVLNKLQKIGWKINTEVFSVYQQCMRIEEGESPFKFSKEIDEQKKKSLLIEVDAIEQIALSNIGSTFYHMYNYDFRGRIYTNTAFLHEQSSDNAKGLLLFSRGYPLLEKGYYWLAVHTSNCYGNDKVSLDDRYFFVCENMGLFLSYATAPMRNTDWMKADKPFSFLACCFELQHILEFEREGNNIEDYVCRLPIYIDGSNNGVQHLVAMSKDETIAHLVNLVPSELPGDVYMYIAKYVWEKLADKASKLTHQERNSFEEIYNTAIQLQKAYQESPEKSEAKASAYMAAQEWRNKNRAIREKLYPVYWLNIDKAKDQRKVVKRNVMTLGYGGTAYGMGQQIIEDTRDMSEYLRDKEHLWGALLGNLVFETCYEKLEGPAKLLRLFQDVAARANERNEFLAWKSPVTNFPVIQGYRKPVDKRTKLRYGNEELKIIVQAWEESTIDKDSQKTGAAPNIVHSLDAVHLAMVVNATPYPVTVVHDSFGCHPTNMDHLFKLVRQEFVNLYAQYPLQNILTQLDCLDLLPELGNLDTSLILESDYAFC